MNAGCLPSHRSDLPHRSDDEQQALFDDSLAGVIAAQARTGMHAYDLLFAGQRIRLCFAASAFVPPLLPAIAHRLVQPAGIPDLTLHVGDNRSTGCGLGPPDAGDHCFTERGDIWTFHSEHVLSAWQGNDATLSLLDTRRRIGIFWLCGAGRPSRAVQASPFHTLIGWWMALQGLYPVHALAVAAGPAAGVLVIGHGKPDLTAVARACREAGLACAGEDGVMLATCGDRLLVHGLYRSAGRHAGVDAFPLQGLPLAAATLLGTTTTTTPDEPALLTAAAVFNTLVRLPHAGAPVVDGITNALAGLPMRPLAVTDAAAVVPAALKALVQRSPVGKPKVVSLPAAVSVIIPVFNGAGFLADAVASLTAQNHQALEIIVVDDGSTDALDDAIAALPVPVRLLRQAHAGPAAARNLGLAAASADIIGFLDVDDLWPAGRLAAMLAWLGAHPGCDVAIGHAQLMEQLPGGAYQFVGSPDDNFPCYIGAALFRRRAFDRVGTFDPLIRFGEDLDWFTRAGHAGARIDRLDIISLQVRRHPGNSTRNKSLAELTPARLAQTAQGGMIAYG